MQPMRVRNTGKRGGFCGGVHGAFFTDVAECDCARNRREILLCSLCSPFAAVQSKVSEQDRLLGSANHSSQSQ